MIGAVKILEVLAFKKILGHLLDQAIITHSVVITPKRQKFRHD